MTPGSGGPYAPPLPPHRGLGIGDRHGPLLERRKGPLPPPVRPEMRHLSAPRRISRGVERAEAAVASQGIERRLQKRRGEILRRPRMQRQLLQQIALSFHRRRGSGMTGPIHPLLVVRRHGRMGDERRPVGRQTGGGVAPRRIEYGHVIAHVAGHAAERRRRLVHRRTGLQDVAQDQGHAKALPHRAPPAEGQRHSEARIVHPVHVTEEPVGRADHLPPALLHKSVDGRGFPFPGRTYPTASVTGRPSAVWPFRTAIRTWSSAT